MRELSAEQWATFNAIFARLDAQELRLDAFEVAMRQNADCMEVQAQRLDDLEQPR